jgi:hypothetical protein
MNIYQKLLEIQKVVKGLGKDKSTFNYKYVTGDKILDEVKPLMNRFGLLLKQEVLSIDNERMDYQTKNGSKSEILSKVMMRFTWIDCETGEQDVNLFGANGQNDWEKGLGSALTYAERYFLLKYFHIATDEDDIDNEQRKKTEPIPLLPNITNEKLTNLCKKITNEGMANAEALKLAKQYFTLTEQDIQIIESCVYITTKLE